MGAEGPRAGPGRCGVTELQIAILAGLGFAALLFGSFLLCALVAAGVAIQEVWYEILLSGRKPPCS